MASEELATSQEFAIKRWKAVPKDDRADVYEVLIRVMVGGVGVQAGEACGAAIDMLASVADPEGIPSSKARG